jgi:hypothetical protein
VVGEAGEGEENVIEIGSMNREFIDNDRLIVEPVKQGFD